MLHLPLKNARLMIDHLHYYYYTPIQELYEVHLILFLDLVNDHKIQLHYILELLYNFHPLKRQIFMTTFS
jgi:hypothetical protein